VRIGLAVQRQISAPQVQCELVRGGRHGAAEGNDVYVR
jgi:hypothetical protein